jgi:sugar/nucleoside kinase (ribokinase family)
LKLQPKERVIVITCGKNPVFIPKLNYNGCKINEVFTCEVIKVPEEEIKDTNGCGDGIFL